MVQEARLDLGRRAAIAAVALALAGPVARAQPLVPNPGLTTLLQPQNLDRSRPLMPEDRAAGTRSGVRQRVPSPCDRRPSTASSAPSSPASLYGGGSGPGDYGRYLPGTPPAAEAGGTKPGAPSPAGATRTAPATRPLYGGNDRPLWNTGERPAPAAAATKPTEPGRQPASAAPVQPNALPAPVRDRPLWTDRSFTDPARSLTEGTPPASSTETETATASTDSASVAPTPCTAAAPRQQF